MIDFDFVREYNQDITRNKVFMNFGSINNVS